MFFVDRVVSIRKGASDIRARTKGIELVILNSFVEELNDLQEFRASHKSVDEIFFNEQHGIHFVI
jgi:hypothetical protein